MREITDHRTNLCNESITVTADERDPKNGNASHIYDVTWQEIDGSGMHIAIEFQHGPIAQVGTNGITQEVLTAILIDLLRCFQDSTYACTENAEALGHYESALAALKRRTEKRVARGVEGTNKV